MQRSISPSVRLYMDDEAGVGVVCGWNGWDHVCTMYARYTRTTLLKSVRGNGFSQYILANTGDVKTENDKKRREGKRKESPIPHTMKCKLHKNA